MTIQEQIKEGIAQHLIPLYGGHKTRGTSDLSDDAQQDALLRARIKAREIMEYEDSQGVVIKVDRELPMNPHFSREDTSDYGLGLMNGFDQALREKAGYVAVEPLV